MSVKRSMNSVIKYPGAKWSLAQWIISKFPPHHSYLEPFFGSGAVLFTKTRSNIETVREVLWMNFEPVVQTTLFGLKEV